MAGNTVESTIPGATEQGSAVLRLVGRGVRARRRSRGWSQARLAEEASLGRAFVCEVERGKANPSLAALARISVALGCAIPELFGTAAHVKTTRTPRAARRSWIDAALILVGRSANTHALGGKYLEVASESENERCKALAKRFTGRLNEADFTRHADVDRSLRAIFEAQEKREKVRAAVLGGAVIVRSTPEGITPEEPGVTWD